MSGLFGQLDGHDRCTKCGNIIPPRPALQEPRLGSCRDSLPTICTGVEQPPLSEAERLEFVNLVNGPTQHP